MGNKLTQQVDGVHYHFVSKAVMEKEIQRGKFVCACVCVVCVCTTL